MSTSTNVGFKIGYAFANLNEKSIDFKLEKAVKFEIGNDFIEIPAYSNEKNAEIEK